MIVVNTVVSILIVRIITYKELVMLKEDQFELDDDTRIIKWKCKKDFTIIYNDCINDDRLSGDSLSILVYVMSKPEDWDIRIREVSKRFSIGRNKTYSIIKSLIEFGYMKRVRKRNKDGSLARSSTYASDRPMFLRVAQVPAFQEVVGIEETVKQPEPEIQGVVTEEKTNKQPCTGNGDMVVTKISDKQPCTGNQDVDNGYVVPYIQKKDVYKENNNNKDYGNTIDARATPPSDELTNIYPDASVVVFFMKKIEGSGVPEDTLVSWLRKYGKDYVAEKVRIYQSKGAMTNPGGFLSSAIRYDWKDKTPTVTESPKPSVKVDLEDAKNWFRYLTDNEKSMHYEKAIKIWPVLEDYLKVKTTSVLDDGFIDCPWFKPMVETLGVKF
jgi:hypothetical protein